jgi:hypothetical protein
MKSKTNKQRARNRRLPIIINDDVWFYEHDKTLQFIVWSAGTPAEQTVTSFRVKKSRLKHYV